jgi:hypothetical protein
MESIMKITKKSHPFLFEAFVAIDHNGGRSFRQRAATTEYEVPERCAKLVVPAERALAAMTKEERETVAIGDQELSDAIISSLGGNAEKLNELLAEHFTGYCAGSNPAGS